MNTIAQANAIAKSMCASGYKYLYGGKGQNYTKALVNQLSALYPSVFTPSLKAEAMKDADKGYKAIDCSGFVCSVLGITQTGSAGLKTNAVKCLSVSKANAKPGMVLWKSGHVAYVGDDLKIYEAQSTATDMKVSTWEKRASAFTYLLIAKGSALAQPTPAPVVTSGTFPKYSGTSTDIDVVFANIGADKYYDTKATKKYLKRRPIAIANGYAGTTYTGSSAQNTALIKKAKAGTLLKP